MDFSRLEKLGIENANDLLNHVPSRYVDYSSLIKISDLVEGEIVTIHATVNSLKNVITRRGMRMQIGSVSDETGKVSVVWFNQPFLIKVLYPGKSISLSGKVTRFSGRLSLSSPVYEMLTEGRDSVHTGKIIPIYPETSGISSKYLRSRIKKVFEASDIHEFLPKGDLKKYNLTELKKSYKFVHFPKSNEETNVGRKRLAFNELLFLQLTSLSRKLNLQKTQSTYKLVSNKKLVDEFIKSLEFTLTKSQLKAVQEVLFDISQGTPMNRLLEGDVGSGKTVVAATTAFVSFINGYQSVFMAPTQILASQHFETLNKLLSPYKVRISLITSNIKKKDLGRADIFVGTHALIHQKLDLDKVALVVIDEQHRFGVEQRKHLVRKSGKRKMSPHVLTMTATPIPRTITQIVYGDLDLSVLTDMPKGRQKVQTHIVNKQKRKDAYTWIQKEIKTNKTQAFIICPLIEESAIETMQDVKAVKTEFEKLKVIFKDLKLGLLHGKLKPKEKNEVLDRFRDEKIDILVSTPVVEVGIDIPNATIMAIEASERFGLAQLHQLRGRVGRGDKKSYCLLFSDIKNSRRLNAMTTTSSGFELAELDLKLRGPGEIFGTRQHGFPELKIANWSEAELIKQTKELAQAIVNNPKRYKPLQSQISQTSNLIV